MSGIVPDAQALDLTSLDPFGTQHDIPSVPAMSSVETTQNPLPCSFRAPPASLALYDAVERSLCHNPKTLQAWASIKEQAAEVGVSESAFLPKLDGTMQYARDHALTDVYRSSSLDSNNYNRFRTDTLNLSWVLFDFGARYASLQNARQLLLAAEATHAATLQQVFLTTAKDYYSAVAARTSVQSTREMEKAAKQSLEAATARVGGGVAAVSDQLQTQTAYAQAVFNRAKAEGEQRAALGTLSLDMGLSPNTPFELAENLDGSLQDVTFIHSVDDLLEEAKQVHPSIKVAQANLDAAVAKEKTVLAQSMPSISFTAKATRNNQPVSFSLGQPEFAASTHDRYVGIELDVPLFEGFANLYKVKSAQAEIEVQQDNLLDAEQQVAQDVWTSYQTFLTDTENLHNTETILQSARLQFEAAQQRYQRGVANVLELMSAQTTLSDALQQRIHALADWRTARLQLAASIGTLGTWAIRQS